MNADEIRKCSDGELARVIAEHVFTPDPTRCERCGWPLVANPEDGCVKDNCSMRTAQGMLPERREPDFVNDASLSMMLLEKLRESSKVVRLTVGTMVWCCAGSEAAPDAEARTLNNIGRAIAECYAQSIQKEQVL